VLIVEDAGGLQAEQAFIILVAGETPVYHNYLPGMLKTGP
jgi:hypothetical protein